MFLIDFIKMLSAMFEGIQHRRVEMFRQGTSIPIDDYSHRLCMIEGWLVGAFSP